MEDLSTMTPGIVIGKIVAFEMSRNYVRWVKKKLLHQSKAKLSHVEKKEDEGQAS